MCAENLVTRKARNKVVDIDRISAAFSFCPKAILKNKQNYSDGEQRLINAFALCPYKASKIQIKKQLSEILI